mgnify:CR=1 FL=1
MPWKIKKDNDRYCVHKLMDDGEMGEKVKCHATKAEAEAHMKALYANMPEEEKAGMMSEFIHESIVGEFRGNFPDVPIAPGVDMEELKALDPDPMFVTLQVVPKVGSVSKNGVLYDENLVTSVERQINEKRPGGIFGHIKDEDRDTSYPIPDGIWVGAKRVGDSLWAKVLVSPGAAKDHIRRLKAVGGQISTSIYGKGSYETVKPGVRRLSRFDLESLDFAPPARAALGHAVTPFVTAEMENTDMDRNQIISELTVKDIPTSLRDAIVAETTATNNQTISELRTQVSDRDSIIAELKNSVAEFQRARVDAAIDAKVTALTDWKVTGDAAKAKLDAFRRTLRSHIVSELAGDVTKLAIVADTVWADLAPVAEAVRDALSGPPARVGGSNGGRVQLPKFEDTPEARAKARAVLGF